MTTFTVPAQLEACIQTAGAAYGVPGDILAGVWYIESGGSFPDNAVNSAGYGGLFGTTDYADTPQGQANFAASVLAHLYARYGTWADTLYHYSGGAYTHVPDQTTTDGGDPFMALTDLNQQVLIWTVSILAGLSTVDQAPLEVQPHVAAVISTLELRKDLDSLATQLNQVAIAVADIKAKLGA